MIYTTVLEAILVVFVCVSVVRLVMQGFFFAVKYNQPFYKGIIPFYSSYQLHKSCGAKKYHILGSALRIAGFALMIGVLLWQYYDSLMQITHMYGVLLHYYEPTDYTVAWNLLSYAGLLFMVAGLITRWFPTRQVSQFFSAKGFVNVLGSIEPALYYLWLTISPKAIYLLNKNPKHMSSEEYQMFCVLSDMK